eukprot:Tbor_TRINITY_DN5252_c0_g1::TRINITY_DN5252_c0_g1_i1::g.16133::m.16133
MSTELEEQFRLAVKLVNSKPPPGVKMPKIDNRTKLTFYGLYKQATEGPRPATMKQPSKLNIAEYYKYIAWGKCKDMSKEVAMEKYLIYAKKTMPQELVSKL